MNKHTPGPWYKSDKTDDMIQITKPDEEGIIAEVWSYHHKDRVDETEANASLIAAAPDLLEALEKIYAEAGVKGGLTWDYYEMARIAIEKAKGAS